MDQLEALRQWLYVSRDLIVPGTDPRTTLNQVIQVIERMQRGKMPPRTGLEPMPDWIDHGRPREEDR